MTYIVRLALGRERGTRYGTATALSCRYREVHKTKRIRDSPIGPIREVEHDRWDKSAVWLRFTSETIVNDRGMKGLHPGNTQFRLLDRHKHIKELRPEDEAVIADADVLIAAKEAELRELRDRRAELVAGAWRRGLKVSLSELEELADARS